MSLTINKLDCSNKTEWIPNRSIKWIVLHYTAGTSSKAGMAYSTALWFRDSDTLASADFCLDDGNIGWQCNPDIRNRCTWAVGGAKYDSVTTSIGGRYHGECTNYNSISIEMCSNKRNTSTLGAYDTDWYLTDATIANARELTKQLMKTYGIDIDHVIIHHEVTGKMCPNPWVLNEASLSGWYNFKQSLSDTFYRVRKLWSDAKSQLGAYSTLDAAKKNCPEGYNVYDENGVPLYTNTVKYALKAKSYLYKKACTGEYYCTIAKGSRVQIVKDNKKGMSQVKFGGYTGYVYNSSIEKSKLSSCKQYKCIHDTWVYENKNDTKAKKMSADKTKEKLKLLKGEKGILYSINGSWARIEYKGKSKWVLSKRIQTV